MRKTTLTQVGLAMGLSAVAATAGEPMTQPAQPVPSSSAITADITLGYHSQYVHRGAVFNDMLVDDIFTFGLGLAYDDGAGNQYFGDVYHRVLGSSAGSQFGGIDDHTTITVGARRELIPNLTGTLAYSLNSGGFYDLGTRAHGQEVQAKLDYKINENFIVYGMAAYEFQTFDGWYFEAGAAYKYDVTDQVALVLSGSIGAFYGFGPEVPGVDNDGVAFYEIRLAAPIAVNQMLTVAPYVSFVGGLDVHDDYETATNGAIEMDSFIAGVEATLTF